MTSDATNVAKKKENNKQLGNLEALIQNPFEHSPIHFNQNNLDSIVNYIYIFSQLGEPPGVIQETFIDALKFIWLVVSTHLKNISQNGNLPQIAVKIKKIETTNQLCLESSKKTYLCSLFANILIKSSWGCLRSMGGRGTHICPKNEIFQGVIILMVQKSGDHQLIWSISHYLTTVLDIQTAVFLAGFLNHKQI